MSAADPTRSAAVHRKTGETDVSLTLTVDGTGTADVSTGVGFLDHMLELFAKHGLFDLTVQATGDTHVDFHHTTEDVGICLGQALSESLGDKRGIRRYGHCTLPMDETLVTAACDLSGRAAFVFGVDFPTPKVGDFDTELVRHFWESVAAHGRMNFHAVLHHGVNSHHIAEAVFKSAARSLRDACEPDPRRNGVPSSKGVL